MTKTKSKKSVLRSRPAKTANRKPSKRPVAVGATPGLPAKTRAGTKNV